MSLRKLLAAIMVVSMVLGLVGTSALAAESEQWDSATVLLQQFGIVTGDASGDLRLNDNITRAEMVKVLVAAAGAEELANLLKGAPSFTDVAADAWYSGYVAFAKNAGITGGYADGTFQPEAQVTYAEVVAFLAKFLGIEPVAGAEWPNNYIQAFENAGLAAEGLNLAEFANAPAVRGWVFTLADNAFRYGGAESVYAYLDGEAPELTVDAVAGTTEATKVTVSGKVSGAEALFVNDAAVEVGADGSFSAEVALAVGANSILVKAVDEVGLEAVKTVEVTRTLAPAASIEAEAITVEAGQTVDVAVKVLDQNGEVIADAEVSGESEVGTFAAGKFTAGEKAGTGTLTLKYGELSKSVAVTVKAGALAKLEVTPSAKSAAPGEMVTFTVKGFDALGNEVSGIAPTFSFEGSDALINPSTGAFIASKAGSYTVTASVGEVKGSAVVGVYDSAAQLVLEGPATLVGNEETKAEFVVKALDEAGNLVADADDTVTVDIGDAVAYDEDGDVIEKAENTNNISLTLEDGVAQFWITASNTEWGQILEFTATATDLEDATAEIEILEQVASGVEVASADKYVTANETDEDVASVTFVVVDQHGEPMLEGTWDLEWKVSGPAEVDGDTEGTEVTGTGEDQSEAAIALDSLKGETGTVTVTASVEGVGTASATLTAAVAGEPTKMLVELDETSATVTDDAAEGIEATVTIVDSRGVPVKVASETVTVTFDADLTDVDTEAGVVEWDSENAADEVELTFANTSSVSFMFAFENADEYEMTVEHADGDFADVTQKVTFTAGTAAKAAFDWNFDNGAARVAVTDPTGTVGIQVVDGYGNAVAKAGVKVTVEASDDDVTLNDEDDKVTVETDAEGKAVISYKVRPYVDNSYTLSIVDADSDVDGLDGEDVVTIEIEPVIPASVSLAIVNDEGNNVNSVYATAAGAVKFVATLKDQFGGTIDSDVWAPYIDIDVDDAAWVDDFEGDTEGTDEEIVEDWAFQAVDADNAYVFNYGVNDGILYGVKADRLSVKVTVNVNGKDLVASDTVRVLPGADKYAVVAEAKDGDIALDEDTVKAVTLKVADKWGNVKSGSKTYLVAFGFNSSEVTVRTASDGANLAPTTVLDGAVDQVGSGITLRTSKTVYLLSTTATAETGYSFEVYLIDDANGDGVVDEGEEVLGTKTYELVVE